MQSVALRLVVDREREIEVFKPQEYWQVSATFEADGQPFTARLVQLDGKKLDRLSIGSKGEADAAKAAVEAGRFTVASVETKPFAKNPPPPFTTSTLQQEAARKLGFSASHTMRVAQSLYEDGLITYMRTDGVDMAEEAISAARKAIANRYDSGFVPDKPRKYTSKAKNAQEAHEAIRPTDFSRAKRLGRSRSAVRAGLQPRAGEPDGFGAAGADDGRADRRSGQGGAPRDRPGRLFPAIRALREGRDDTEDEEGARMPACATAMLRPRPGRGDAAASPSRRRAIPKRAWSSVWRSSASGAVDLRIDPADAEGPRICARRQGPLHSGGERAARHRVPRTLLRTLRELRLHGRA